MNINFTHTNKIPRVVRPNKIIVEPVELEDAAADYGFSAGVGSALCSLREKCLEKKFLAIL